MLFVNYNLLQRISKVKFSSRFTLMPNKIWVFPLHRTKRAILTCYIIASFDRNLRIIEWKWLQIRRTIWKFDVKLRVTTFFRHDQKKFLLNDDATWHEIRVNMCLTLKACWTRAPRSMETSMIIIQVHEMQFASECDLFVEILRYFGDRYIVSTLLNDILYNKCAIENCMKMCHQRMIQSFQT